MKIILPFFLMASVGIALTGCSTPGYNPSYQKSPPAKAPPDPKPPQPPETKPVFYSRCDISNGEGRIFHATDESQDMAEIKARHECEIYSRHCVLLGCTETMEEDE